MLDFLIVNMLFILILRELTKELVTELMNKLNLVKDDVIAIGDSATDIPLFKVAKTSVALGNASDFVRSVLLCACLQVAVMVF